MDNKREQEQEEEREKFIRTYVDAYVKEWTRLTLLIPGKFPYVDQPSSSTRMLARSQAAGLWEVRNVAR
jgi:hypothetical protein